MRKQRDGSLASSLASEPSFIHEHITPSPFPQSGKQDVSPFQRARRKNRLPPSVPRPEGTRSHVRRLCVSRSQTRLQTVEPSPCLPQTVCPLFPQSGKQDVSPFQRARHKNRPPPSVPRPEGPRSHVRRFCVSRSQTRL